MHPDATEFRSDYVPCASMIDAGNVIFACNLMQNLKPKAAEWKLFILSLILTVLHREVSRISIKSNVAHDRLTLLTIHQQNSVYHSFFGTIMK